MADVTVYLRLQEIMPKRFSSISLKGEQVKCKFGKHEFGVELA
jgi:hypothetical protein